MKTCFKSLYQVIENLQIFKLFYAFLLLLVSLNPAMAKKGPKEPLARKELKVKGAFQNSRIFKHYTWQQIKKVIS